METGVDNDHTVLKTEQRQDYETVFIAFIAYPSEESNWQWNLLYLILYKDLYGNAMKLINHSLCLSSELSFNWNSMNLVRCLSWKHSLSILFRMHMVTVTNWNRRKQHHIFLSLSSCRYHTSHWVLFTVPRLCVSLRKSKMYVWDRME